MKSTLDWEAFVGPSSGITEQEMKNPANHPFSHSKFFSFQEDTTIYHMIRGGATVAQVGRTLGKPATFIERRLHNAQFKLRVQYILKQEKQQSRMTQQDHARAGSKLYGARQDAENDIHAAPPKYPNMTESALRGPPTQSFFHSSFHDPTEAQRKREWQPTFPGAQTPRYEVDMSLEELGEKDGLLRGRGKARTPNVSYKGHASKVSHSYENYKRLKGTKRK
ncbi:hypothetical protein AGDE_10219 [Angomonas deanei]|uniref:Uncharacterized protein n=1 Tax=Angomonas deanei TaxID=59799 RepID=A0A7G2BZZ0_9TRYP|nr:hypothetical protein AGDE_10219 [Angomonas deanei]CAD2213079.1 hypothetical protein, conserved [Angomonas deanei]|eukprot:EPY28913.1 hypothetical protein AGDE_10219 [Angomonas deanei]